LVTLVISHQVMIGAKRPRVTENRDVWIIPEVKELNGKHLRYWKEQKLADIESDRSGALRTLCDQDSEFLDTCVHEWLHPKCTSVKRHSDGGNPIDCDVLILRPNPCRSCLTHKEGTAYVDEKTGFMSDHSTFIHNFEAFGLHNRKVFSLYYAPFYTANKQFRGLSTKNAREILGWRALMALWLIRPTYILGANKLTCQLINAKFDSRKFEGISPLDYGKVKSLKIKGPLVLGRCPNIIVRAIRIDHPFLFSPNNSTPTMKSRDTFRAVTKCLQEALDEADGHRERQAGVVPYVQLLQNALRPARLVSVKQEMASEEEKEAIAMAPTWLTVDNWNLFYAPRGGPCVCEICGGCGAEADVTLNADATDISTIYPKKTCYTTRWIKDAQRPCDRCQCKHGHRSIDFDECMQGCPVKGVCSEAYVTRHTITERFTAKEFVEQLLSCPSYFNNEKMNRMMGVIT